MSDKQDQTRRGRPRLAQSARRGTRIVTMVTDQQFRALQTRAEQSQMTMSALCQKSLDRAVQASAAGDVDAFNPTSKRDRN